MHILYALMILYFLLSVPMHICHLYNIAGNVFLMPILDY